MKTKRLKIRRIFCNIARINKNIKQKKQEPITGQCIKAAVAIELMIIAAQKT